MSRAFRSDISANRKKRKSNPRCGETKTRKTKQNKTKLRSSLNNGGSHTHVQRCSTAVTSKVVTSYSNIPTNFISSWQWAEVNAMH
jgi:hypothetical protein